MKKRHVGDGGGGAGQTRARHVACGRRRHRHELREVIAKIIAVQARIPPIKFTKLVSITRRDVSLDVAAAACPVYACRLQRGYKPIQLVVVESLSITMRRDPVLIRLRHIRLGKRLT